MTVYEAVVSRLAMLGYTVTDNDETGLNFLIDKCEKDILADINQRVLPDGLFYGLAYACSTAMLPFIVREVFGGRDFDKIYSWMIMIFNGRP